MKLFCFGLGYSAQNLIAELSSTSWQYSGTHKSSGKYIFSDDHPLINAKETLKDVTHLLISIPPKKSGHDLVLAHHKQDIINMPSLKWVGYLSAISVYGDHNGAWVDENTPPIPTIDRGKARLNAENEWLSLNLPVHIFRLGGLYGPGRNQINAVLNKTARKIIRKNHLFSRIHVDDIVGALLASINKPDGAKPDGDSIYNIVDDHPATSADVLDHICHLLKNDIIEAIPLDDKSLSPMLRSFYHDNKKVKNDLAKNKLGWKLKFPSYREGYAQILLELD